MNENIESTSISIPNEIGGLVFKYYVRPFGYQDKSISANLGITFGRKIGNKFTILLKGGANIGFVPIQMKLITSNYTGKGFKTQPIEYGDRTLSTSTGSYFYLTPAIRYYF